MAWASWPSRSSSVSSPFWPSSSRASHPDVRQGRQTRLALVHRGGTWASDGLHGTAPDMRCAPCSCRGCQRYCLS
jgi:hypothetical protein